MKYLTVPNILIVALAVAVIGFLSISVYRPEDGIIGNVMSGQIWLNDDCSAINSDGTLADRTDCVLVSYKWILALDMAAVAAALIIRKRISN